MDLTPLFDAIIVLDRSYSRHLTANNEALLGVLGIRDNWPSSTLRDNSLGTFRDKG